MKKTLFPLLLAFLLSVSSQAAVIFDFFDNGVGEPSDAIDGGGNGASMTATGSEGTTTLSTVDILVAEYDAAGLPTGNILSAAGVTNINGNADALGINASAINNSDWDTITGDPAGNGTEANDINGGEEWIFEFDQDVTLDEFEFESLEAGDTFTLSIAGGPSFTTTYLEAAIPTDLALTDFRLESLTVSIVPEPSSAILAGLGIFSLALRRGRK